ncbi:hypothetical protein PG913_07940 [Tenacibaculum pacificus]|uniref:arabinofuranosidase catalytic domain-containing protein n=1 Tax=Tenacibaculum pacificus TaxID=3018314 RepID=UPI0022F3A12D|nr:arabinofuranosidase catalytic domain-containing protein [Tenacibaculum pacificus]WBX72836.1 hypothetical protein PG913_07940 [Tenacibaculum pacificus]
MNKYILILLLATTLSGYSQIAKYNNFPTKKPHHILDDKLDNISFAFSMRVIESNYNGPIIRLRRASDNAEQDFGWADNDIVDVNAINTWKGTSNVFVHTWYDQSGLGRNAVQTTQHRQPRFYPDVTIPYFQGDGRNDNNVNNQGDHLTIDTPNGIQDLTNNGNEGTVISVIKATKKNQHTFGVLVDENRWSTHINWNDNYLYFDPGVCCNNTRRFYNNTNINVWQIYSFIKTTTNTIARSGTIEMFNNVYTKGKCNRTEDFAIGWATGNKPNSRTTSSFNEIIMYNTNINTIQIQEIEQNSITFWGI